MNHTAMAVIQTESPSSIDCNSCDNRIYWASPIDKTIKRGYPNGNNNEVVRREVWERGRESRREGGRERRRVGGRCGRKGEMRGFVTCANVYLYYFPQAEIC